MDFDLNNFFTKVVIISKVEYFLYAKRQSLQWATRSTSWFQENEPSISSQNEFAPGAQQSLMDLLSTSSESDNSENSIGMFESILLRFPYKCCISFSVRPSRDRCVFMRKLKANVRLLKGILIIDVPENRQLEALRELRAFARNLR